MILQANVRWLVRAGSPCIQSTTLEKGRLLMPKSLKWNFGLQKKTLIPHLCTCSSVSFSLCIYIYLCLRLGLAEDSWLPTSARLNYLQSSLHKYVPEQCSEPSVPQRSTSPSIQWDTWTCKCGLANVPTRPRTSQDQSSAKVSPKSISYSIIYSHISNYGQSLRPKVKGTMWMPLGECPIALAAVPWRFLCLALYTPYTVVSPNYPHFPLEILA